MKSMNEHRSIDWGDVWVNTIIGILVVALIALAVCLSLFLADVCITDSTVTESTGEIINLQAYSKQTSKSSSRMIYEVYLMDDGKCVCVQTQNTRFMTLKVGQKVGYEIVDTHGNVTGWHHVTKLLLK